MSQEEFNKWIKTMPNDKIIMLALSKLLLKDAESDGEAGAMAIELKKRSKTL